MSFTQLQDTHTYPSNRNLSRTSMRCGDVKSPVWKPQLRNIDSVKVQVDPFITQKINKWNEISNDQQKIRLTMLVIEKTHIRSSIHNWISKTKKFKASQFPMPTRNTANTQVATFPLVPATWITFICFIGSSSSSICSLYHHIHYISTQHLLHSAHRHIPRFPKIFPLNLYLNIIE